MLSVNITKSLAMWKSIFSGHLKKHSEVPQLHLFTSLASRFLTNHAQHFTKLIEAFTLTSEAVCTRHQGADNLCIIPFLKLKRTNDICQEFPASDPCGLARQGRWAASYPVSLCQRKRENSAQVWVSVVFLGLSYQSWNLIFMPI